MCITHLLLVGCTSLSHETGEVLNGRFHHLLPQIYPHSHSISTPFASAESGCRALSLRGQQHALCTDSYSSQTPTNQVQYI